MRVLGIDPGSRLMGWGVVLAEGTRVTHIAHGVIHAMGDGGFADRLVRIDAALVSVIETHAPDVGAIEGMFYSKDPQSAAKLGHARGVALLRLAHAGLAIHEYEPARVKRAIVGRGAADKRQVAMVVSKVLGLDEPPPPDAADALAVAMTHLAMARFDQAIAASAGRRPAQKRARAPVRRRGR